MAVYFDIFLRCGSGGGRQTHRYTYVYYYLISFFVQYSIGWHVMFKLIW